MATIQARPQPYDHDEYLAIPPATHTALVLALHKTGCQATPEAILSLSRLWLHLTERT